MSESNKIVLEIIKLLYPEWIENQKNKYQELEEYEQYKKVFLNVFGYDLERLVLEEKRGVDLSDLERKIAIMKLIGELKKSSQKEKGKNK